MVGGSARLHARARPSATTSRYIPALGLAGGACGGYGLLLDIRDPTRPVRIDAVADSNFAYWHSATFNNDGTKILFTDEWGGGGAPKCRATDKKEWGANAIFTLENGKMVFKSYYKLPAAQTSEENCVAHNGSLIPIPGRDVMVQGWYQGGISVFDWTDAANPKEIAYFDRGPADSTRMASGGSWSIYWYNGAMYSSEIARGLDILELTPSEFVSQNEIDAAKTVHLDYFNAQGQPKFVWPPSFALARAYVDQLERSKCVAADRIAAVRQSLTERRAGVGRRSAAMRLAQAASQVGGMTACDGGKVQKAAGGGEGFGAAAVTKRRWKGATGAEGAERVFPLAPSAPLALLAPQLPAPPPVPAATPSPGHSASATPRAPAPARASSKRPSFLSKSPRTLGSRW